MDEIIFVCDWDISIYSILTLISDVTHNYINNRCDFHSSNEKNCIDQIIKSKAVTWKKK